MAETVNTTPATTDATAEAAATRRNEKVGLVVSTKMQKTIVVEIEMRKAHPKYKRVMKSNKKFYAHDEQNSARVGDVVRIREARPLSKLKRWSLEEIVRRSSLAQAEDKAPVAAPAK
ncbi:small subunit ribosomal protein S17 [Granulicella aggregans]|jgi:small subunit ribosomal protein S17|uniref:Small ribosomal subunit protein uS17 n=1 Tax=Granulicella aggregans TaxID=474949 RepID=A0A7W8E292_9BACT|nr:30S ribosomal protein S17 [Granulicella aggregans]MBB5056101.1 small subunit ribosomal protein S17 [Granulicella aggregans]